MTQQITIIPRSSLDSRFSRESSELAGLVRAAGILDQIFSIRTDFCLDYLDHFGGNNGFGFKMFRDNTCLGRVMDIDCEKKQVNIYSNDPVVLKLAVDFYNDVLLKSPHSSMNSPYIFVEEIIGGKS